MLVSYMSAQPQKLPTKYEGMTETELNAAGFVICPDKPDVVPGQTLWWENNQWTVREPTDSELAIQWQAVKNQAERYLSETDYKVLKAYESQNLVDPQWIAYRQSLRDIYNNVDSINPFAVEWPEKP
jgi:hypothetical protein